MRLRVCALAEVVGRRVVRGDVVFGVVGIIIIIITITVVVVVAFVAVAVALVVAAATAAFAECRARGQEIRVYVADVARRTGVGAEFGDEEERGGGNVLLLIAKRIRSVTKLVFFFPFFFLQAGLR